MKNLNFLILTATVLVMFLTGCNATTSHLYRVSDNGLGLVETTRPIPIEKSVERGISLALGNRSHLNIDVECILEYVQGESETIENQPILQENHYPWIRFSLNF